MEVLSDSQIEHVLQMQVVGRLGVTNGDTPHVIPIAYVFDGKDIYAHSKEGQKILLMRKHPKICFQVDDIDDLENWRSVILYGVYEELTRNDHIQYATSLIRDRFQPILAADVTQEPDPECDPPKAVQKVRKAIYYRIRITERSGRYQKSHAN